MFGTSIVMLSVLIAPLWSSWPTLRNLLLTAVVIVVATGNPAISFAETSTPDVNTWPIPDDVPKATQPNPGLAGSKPYGILRFLLARGPANFALSADGNSLAFLARDTGQPQLYTLKRGQSSPQQITFGRAVQSFYWLPDGERLLYSADREGNERESYTLIEANGRREQKLRQSGDAFLSFGDFSSDGKSLAYASTERNGVDYDVFSQDLKTGKRRELYRGTFGFYPRAWRPNSSEMLVSETRGEDGNNLYLLNSRNGSLLTLFAPQVSSAYEGMIWALDGKGFYLSTDHNRELAALAYYDLKAKKLQWLDTPAHPVGNVTLFDNDRKLAWTVNVNGFDQLHVRDLIRGKQLDVPDLAEGVISLSGARRANLLGIRISGPYTPGELWTWQPGSPAILRVAPTMAGLTSQDLAMPKPVQFPARDDVMLHGLLYPPMTDVPAQPGRLPPTLIRVHGGPTGQARPRFDPAIQYLSGRGYAVLDLNFRGSTGYGKSFARLDNGRLRPNAVRDIQDAIDWLAENKSGDVERLAIMGGSYGGYLTNAAVGAFPDAFKAAVSFVGVSDWVRALEQASPALKASDRLEYGDINDPEDRKFFTAISPLAVVDRVRTPMVVVHGANDPRDPVSESDRFVTAVRKQEVEVKYLRFADEGHSLRKLGNRITAYQTIADFLDEKLGTKP